MNRSRLQQWIRTGVFAALIAIATLLIQIPLPATGGYANAGDGVILTCAFILAPLPAALAAGVGSALADLILGYVIYAPATLLIKGGMALTAAFGFRRMAKAKSYARYLLPAVLAEGVMVLGYLVYEAFVLGLHSAALGSVMGNVGQGIVGILIGCAMTPLLKKIKVFQ